MPDHLCPRCFKVHVPGVDCYPVGPGTVSDPDVRLTLTTPPPERSAEVTRHMARLAALEAVAREARIVFTGRVSWFDPAWKRLAEVLKDLDSLGPATPPVPSRNHTPPTWTLPRRSLPNPDLKAADEVQRPTAEVERLNARCNHLRSQWTGTLTREIGTQQTSDYERARALAEGRVNQAMATWDRLYREEREDKNDA